MQNKVRKLAIIIGSGPSGLMAAEQLALKGLEVLVAERKPSLARKFLMAGKSGLNLTNDDKIEDFTTKFEAAVRSLEMGNGDKEGVAVGPLIDQNAAASVCDFIDDAVSKGAKLIAGGAKSPLGDCFVEPTILTNVSRDMRVFSEEIFGPVAPIFTFETEVEAIEMANDTEFGLAAYFYSRDIGRIYRVAEKLEYGIIGINEGIISNEMAPFGGVKESGNGREGSKYGLDDYLDIKYMCIGGIHQ